MKVFGFDEKGAGRIQSAVVRVEKSFRNAAPARGRYPAGAGGGSGLIPCVITSNVTAGSEASPTSFSATIEVPASGAGLTTTGGTSVTAYNRAAGISFSASGGSPKSAWLTLFNGRYYLVSADC
jgi:hypothetical protein